MVKFSPTIYVLYLLNPWEISSTLNDGIWASLQRFSGGQLSLTESVRSENSAVVGIAIIIETPFFVCEVFPVYKFFSLFWITKIAENMQYWLRSFQFCNWITVTLIASSDVQCQNIQISQKICFHEHHRMKRQASFLWKVVVLFLWQKLLLFVIFATYMCFISAVSVWEGLGKR